MKLKNIQGHVHSVFQSARSGSHVNVRAETHDKHMRVNGSAAAVCVCEDNDNDTLGRMKPRTDERQTRVC